MTILHIQVYALRDNGRIVSMHATKPGAKRARKQVVRNMFRRWESKRPPTYRDVKWAMQKYSVATILIGD